MYELGDWKPDQDELERAPRTEFADGIYAVTVHEGTPKEWLKLAQIASIASYDEHPEPGLLPAGQL